jgi:hypothetical protein
MRTSGSAREIAGAASAARTRTAGSERIDLVVVLVIDLVFVLVIVREQTRVVR